MASAEFGDGQVSRIARGDGALTVEQQQEAVVVLLVGGESQSAVAERFKVSKNTIAGIWRRYGEPVLKREPTTLWDRCEALHVACDAVLRETVGVGRIHEEHAGRMA